MFIHFLETKNLLRLIYFLLITWFHRLQVIEQLIRSFNVVNFSKICSNISTNIISMLQKSNKISFIGQIIKKYASNSSIQNVLQFLPFVNYFCWICNKSKQNKCQGFVTILRLTSTVGSVATVSRHWDHTTGVTYLKLIGKCGTFKF